MDRSQIGAVVNALFLEPSQVLFGFLEVHFDAPTQSINLQNVTILKMTSSRQKYGPVVLARL